MEIDFGGIGKEYAADRAAAILQAIGVNHGLIELGGDIRVVGPRPDGQPWHIGIRDPRRAGELVTSVFLAQGALATSGDYARAIQYDGRRYGHILHPATGWPVSGLCSVSIIAEDCLIAGTLATVAILKGRAGTAWLDTLAIPYLAIDDQGDFSRSHWPEPPRSVKVAA